MHGHVLDAVALAEIAHLLSVYFLFKYVPFIEWVFLESGVGRDDVVLLRMLGVLEAETEGH